LGWIPAYASITLTFKSGHVLQVPGLKDAESANREARQQAENGKLKKRKKNRTGKI
jgi:hypothetical protein